MKQERTIIACCLKIIITPENMHHTYLRRVFKEKADNETNICNIDISHSQSD